MRRRMRRMGAEIQLKAYEQQQEQLFPGHLRDALDPSDPVLFIGDAVGSLEVLGFEGRHAVVGERVRDRLKLPHSLPGEGRWGIRYDDQPPAARYRRTVLRASPSSRLIRFVPQPCARKRSIATTSSGVRIRSPHRPWARGNAARAARRRAVPTGTVRDGMHARGRWLLRQQHCASTRSFAQDHW